jgi:hypothetical protein
MDTYQKEGSRLVDFKMWQFRHEPQDELSDMMAFVFFRLEVFSLPLILA